VWDITPPGKVAVMAVMGVAVEGRVLGRDALALRRFVHRDGDHAIMSRVVEFAFW
jgi:hypothetical protein